MGDFDYEYELERIIKYVDGDTFDPVLSKDIGFHMRGQAFVRIRLLYVDTYETRKGTIADRQKGIQAGQFTAAWLQRHMGYVWVRTVDQDSFGRWLSEVYAFYPGTQTTIVLADELVEAGFQKPDSEWGPKP